MVEQKPAVFASAVFNLIGGVRRIGAKPTACTWRLSTKFVPTGMGIQDRENVEERFLSREMGGLLLLVVAFMRSMLTHQRGRLALVLKVVIILPFAPTNEKGAERLLSL